MPTIRLTPEEIIACAKQDGDLPSSAQGRVITMLERRIGRDVDHGEFERILMATIIEKVVQIDALRFSLGVTNSRP